jgi:hypothetical protein
MGKEVNLSMYHPSEGAREKEREREGVGARHKERKWRGASCRVAHLEGAAGPLDDLELLEVERALDAHDGIDGEVRCEEEGRGGRGEGG